MMRPQSLINVRAFVGGLAALIGILALWLIAAELITPRLTYFPSNRNEAEALYAVRGSAATAAEVGMVRGDLWTFAAITRAAPLLFAATGSSPEQAPQAEVENMRAIADRAARLSPHDSAHLARVSRSQFAPWRQQSQDGRNPQTIILYRTE